MKFLEPLKKMTPQLSCYLCQMFVSVLFYSISEIEIFLRPLFLQYIKKTNEKKIINCISNAQEGIHNVSMLQGRFLRLCRATLSHFNSHSVISRPDHQHHLGTQKCKVSGPSPNLLNQKLLEQASTITVLESSLPTYSRGGSNPQQNLKKRKSFQLIPQLKST